MSTLVSNTGSTATAYTDATATEAGETYAYRVKAVRGEERSEASGEAEVQVPHDPADLAPTGLSAVLVEGGGVALSWSAPAEDAGSVTGYEVLRAVGEGELTTLKADTASTTTTYTDATATQSGETYAYWVKAIRGSDRSQASGQAQVQLPHDPADLRPTGLTVSLVDNRVTLGWTAPADEADSVTGYEILRRRPMAGESTLATLVADTGSTATTYTDATANEAGVRYVYRVKARRGDDVSLRSNYVGIELPSDYVAPQEEEPEPDTTPTDLAPTGLTAALVDSGGGVTLTWSAPSEDADSVTGYEVLRAVGEGDMATLVADTASTTTTYTDATATEAGETYAYEVKAIRGEETSRASNRVAVTTGEATSEESTGKTSTVAATMTVGTAIASNGDLLAGYTTLGGILGRISGDTFELAGVETRVKTLILRSGNLTLALQPGPTGDYLLEIGDDSFNSTDGTLIASGTMRSWAAASLSWSDGQQVTVELRASVADEPESAPTSAPGPLTGFTLVDATDQTALATIGDGAALDLDDPDNGSYSIRVETDADVDIGSVRLELSGQKTEDQTENWGPYSLYGDDGSSLHGSPLPSGSYSLRATAYASAGLQGAVLGTLEVTFTVTSDTDEPGIPSGLVPYGAGTSIGLSWTAPADDGGSAVTGYLIEYSEDSGDTWQTLVADTGTTATEHVLSSAQPETTLHYRVSAVNEHGAGPPSDAIGVTIVAPAAGEQPAAAEFV